jgi:hypothetical protein
VWENSSAGIAPHPGYVTISFTPYVEEDNAKRQEGARDGAPEEVLRPLASF